jgi:hypothetical protein
LIQKLFAITCFSDGCFGRSILVGQGDPASSDFLDDCRVVPISFVGADAAFEQIDVDRSKRQSLSRVRGDVAA